MIGLRKIDHIGIRVRDKHRSIAFYEELVPTLRIRCAV